MRNVYISIAILVSFMVLASCQVARHDKNIEVVSIEREINTNSPDHTICSEFTLTKSQVIEYFATAVEVDEYEFHHEALIMPCKYKGKIKIGTDLFQWEIYAGGAGYLYKNELVNKKYLCKEDCWNVLPNLR